MKAIGPHVHHRDVVRAALTHMQEQLDHEGPGSEAALDMIRRMAHPADELADAVHQRDFARLRDMVRNRPPSDLASAFSDLSLEDQVVTFRVLPRKLAQRHSSICRATSSTRSSRRWHRRTSRGF
jgi:hypothetical protein